jgi:hypothetical protein
MDAKDWIFAQNWVEQYKANIPVSLNLSEAFGWVVTPQGSRVWNHRYYRQCLETEL